MTLFNDCWCCSRRMKKKDIFVENQKGNPRYEFVVRSQCPLLQACWDQDWDAAIRRLERKPGEAFYRSQHSGRTALHLATIPSVGSPSIELIRKLIEINPHAVLVSDHLHPLSVADYNKNGNSPIHFICGNKTIRENPSLVRFFIETALKDREKTHAFVSSSVGVNSWSPLYLASSRSAPAETLDILVQSKKFVPWIAPWTGTETIEESQLILCDRTYSPLLALWEKTRQDIPGFPFLNDDLVCEMREIAQSMLGRDVDEISVKLICFPTRSSHLDAWVRIFTLFRNPCVDYTSHTLLHRVSTLQLPIPELVNLVCRLFPAQMLQEVSVSATCPEIPLHSVLRHSQSGKAADSIQEIIQILMTAQPESLIRIHESTSLYTVFLAASCNTSLDILFDMTRLSPHALQLQRVA